MYRYSRPQAGRYREHRQFGVEVFGTDAPGADVEVIALGDAFLRSLGLRRYRLELNSLGDEVCRPAYRTALIAYLTEHAEELRDEHKDRFADNPLRVLDCKDEACRAVAAGRARHAGAPLRRVRRAFRRRGRGRARGRARTPVITPTLVRGLDYYTRTAFEFVSDAMQEGGNAQQATLFGGGRYDGLAEALGGPRVPGVGFGMGLERVLLARGRRRASRRRASQPLAAYVVAIGECGPRRPPGRSSRSSATAGIGCRSRVRGSSAEGPAQDGRSCRRRASR